MKNPLVMAIAAVALIAGANPASAQAGTPPSQTGDAPITDPIARQPAPRTGQSLDGVRNGTTKEERDRHGSLDEIDPSVRPELIGPAPDRRS
jgi:hypothetical protein